MEKKHGWRWWDFVLVALILCLVVGIVQGASVCRKQEKQIQELSSDLHIQKQQTKMEREMRVEVFADKLQAERQLKFYEENIGLISENNKYHTYGCEDFDDSSFWGYNVEQAEALGYRPCPKCR